MENFATEDEYVSDIFISAFKFKSNKHLNFLFQIIIRLNGGKHKNADEIKMELTDGLTLKHVIKSAMKKLSSKDSYSSAKIYNKNGVMLFENDFGLIAHGDILYLAPRGKFSLYLLECFR
jgi:hypothetical protein